MARTRSFEKADVLDQIMIYFWQHGFEQTGLRELGTATGIKAQSLYNAFGNKQALFEQALAHYVQVASELAQTIVADAKLDGWEQLRELLVLDWGQLPYPAGCMIVSSVSEFDQIDPQLNAVSNQLFDCLTTAFSQVLTKLQTELRTNLDIAATATMLLTVHNGIQLAVRDFEYPTAVSAIVDSTLAGLKGE